MMKEHFNLCRSYFQLFDILNKKKLKKKSHFISISIQKSLIKRDGGGRKKILWAKLMEVRRK